MKYSFLSKTAWLLFAFGLILALGGQFIRLSVIYDLYIPGTLTLKSWYTWQIQHQTIKLYANAFVYCGVGYIIATLGSIVAAVLSFSYLRQKGWMFMGIVLWLLAVIFSAKSIYSDYLLSTYLLSPSANTSQALTMVTTSLQKESVYFLVSLLCQISVVVIVVFKPLNKKNFN